MSLRVLGVDPGLTRCGLGIVDVDANRSARLVSVFVVRTPHDLAIHRRLLQIADVLEDEMTKHAPEAVAVERVFAQHNLRTVMGTAQVSGLALYAAARHNVSVALHTPTEVKAAITGYGSAPKQQVGAMVARILGLAAAPTPADASDALALAICHAWSALSLGTVTPDTRGDILTPAQRAWHAAASAARVPGPRSKLIQ